MRCPVCNVALASDAQFCSRCGHALVPIRQPRTGSSVGQGVGQGLGMGVGCCCLFPAILLVILLLLIGGSVPHNRGGDPHTVTHTQSAEPPLTAEEQQYVDALRANDELVSDRCIAVADAIDDCVQGGRPWSRTCSARLVELTQAANAGKKLQAPARFKPVDRLYKESLETILQMASGTDAAVKRNDQPALRRCLLYAVTGRAQRDDAITKLDSILLDIEE